MIQKLQIIKEKGWVRTHRKGNTGIGKTLEDLLGIKENNVPGPNAAMIELKATRKNALSMITLFTKSPLPRKVNSTLLERYGYESSRGNRRKELHTTVSAKEFSSIKGNPGFKIDVKEDRINLININSEVLAYWDRETLKDSFERKLPKLLFVRADARLRDGVEEFWFNEVWLLSGFNFDGFVQLLKEGIILVDIRIGQYQDGRTHDHGTAFRIYPDNLDLCFSHRERII
ncbi:MAG: MvaI/BcnI family restriction endonuclease [Nitrososphaeria archaeon]